MKLLSVAIPCYNSQDYMRHCVETLLPGGEEVEILIVNDGSKDGTAQIANELAADYPSIVRAVHQDNGGHGAAVMAGLQAATGRYFKVVDSDDWVDGAAYASILQALRMLTAQDTCVDLFLSNYVYDKVGAVHKHVMRYANVLPQETVFTWDEIKRFRMGQYILMHSAIYRTQLLRDCGLVLPRHTFYVDNLYVYIPMQAVQTMYYLDVNFYHYYIGREDQSVNEQIMLKRIDQQIRVNKLMLESVDLAQVQPLYKRKYMFNYLEIITTVSSILLIKSGTPEHLQKKEELWQYLKQQNLNVYRRLRRRPFGILVHLPGKAGRKLAAWGYTVSQKLIGFN